CPPPRPPPPPSGGGGGCAPPPPGGGGGKKFSCRAPRPPAHKTPYLPRGAPRAGTRAEGPVRHGREEESGGVLAYAARQSGVAIGATAVAIRTDNDLLTAIPAFHHKGLKVYGWRWPSAQRDGAMKEADHAASLLSKGLDGYIADPEGAPGKPFDWDRRGLDHL